MIQQATDREVVAAYIDVLRRKIEDGTLDPEVAEVARFVPDIDHPREAVLSQLPRDGVGDHSQGRERDPSPFVSRNPLVSMVQSELERQLRDEGRAEDLGERRQPGPSGQA